MAQEEETQKCGNSNSGGGVTIGHTGRSSKKQKQKKVPQRGLGVAQLEKIRLEEQQKKDGSTILTSPPPITPTKLSSLSVPIPNCRSYSSPIPYPPDLSSPDSILRPPKIDFNSSNTVPLVNTVGWQSVPVQGHGNLPKMWNSCEYNIERESCGVDPGLAFRSSLNLPCASSPIWPLPGLMQRAQQYQQSSSSSLMMNIPSASSSSSMKNFQMEPPSNQSYYGDYTSVWPEEEKVPGMKRPYPFSQDSPPDPSFQYKFPAPIFHPFSTSDESVSFGNGGTFNFNHSNTSFRESPSCSNSESNLKKHKKENASFNGDFLTLAPSASTTLPGFPNPNYEIFDFNSLPHQGDMEDTILQTGSSVPNPQQPYYSFLPPAIMQSGQAPRTINNCNGDEIEENVDLNLKL